MTTPYPPEFFRREDDSGDPLFYAMPRLVVHIDEHAIGAIGEYLRRTLPENGAVLDLMSSWRSHLPEGFPLSRVVGLGLNAVEMEQNPQLHEGVVHDLNVQPVLPFSDGVFDIALISVSIQYVIRPVELFQEAARVLKAGAGLHVFYSNRMFPTKAVAVWKMLDDRQRAELIASYFHNAGGWEEPQAMDISPQTNVYADPVFVVTARKAV